MADAVRSDPMAAFAPVRALRFGLAAATHPDRWRALDLPESAVARLLADGRAAAMLSERLDWLAPGADDFDGWENALASPSGRWAVRGGAWLWRAALRLGAARHRERIARLLRREDVVAFKAGTDDDAYRFALRQAPLVRGASALAAPGGDGPDAAPAETARRSAGWGLGCWLAGLPRGLAARVRLKLPPALDGRLAEAEAWPPERREAWAAALLEVFTLTAGA